MLPSVLLLDDEIEVLNSLERLLRKNYRVSSFTDARAALKSFKDSPTHIVISDLKMPDIDGGEFLKAIAKLNSRTKCIALTGYADTELAQKAINDGKISYYVTKPWDNDDLKQKLALLIQALKVEHAQLNTLKRLANDSHKHKLEQHSVEMLFDMMQEKQDSLTQQVSQLKHMNRDMIMLNANMIALVTNDDEGHSERVAQQARVMVKMLGGDQEQQSATYLAGLLHRIGIMSLPKEIRKKSWWTMTNHQKQHYLDYIQISKKILSTSEFLVPCGDIVGAITENVDGSGFPLKLSGDEIPLGSKILNFLIYIDLLILGKITGSSVAPASALAAVEAKLGKCFDRSIYDCYYKMIMRSNGTEQYQIPKLVSALSVGMELSQDLLDCNEHKLLAEGTVLKALHIDKLQELQRARSDTAMVVFVLSSKTA